VGNVLNREDKDQFNSFSPVISTCLSSAMADPKIGETYALKFVDVDGNTQSTADGRITVLVLTNKAGFSKARLVGERVPDRCLANPAYRMITVVKFAKHSMPFQKFSPLWPRGRLDKEAAILQERYVARKIEKERAPRCFLPCRFWWARSRRNCKAKQSVFRVLVSGQRASCCGDLTMCQRLNKLAEVLK